MDLISAIAFGITIMVLSYVSFIGKVVIFFAIGWWIFFLFFSKNPVYKKISVKIILGILLVLTIFEAYYI